MEYGDWKMLGNREYKKMPDGRNLLMEQCECICGNIKFVQRQHLRSGASKNCGCKKVERGYRLGKSLIKHGMTKTPFFHIWLSMIARCNYVKYKNYHRYGGRGIIVCDRWRNSFENFYEDMGPRPSNKHSIDRINNDGNYEPSNCRWATIIEQQNNTSNNVFYTYKGETLTMAQLSRKYNVSRILLSDRLRKLGWNINEAIETPSGFKRDDLKA